MALTKYKLGDLMIPFSKACGIPDLDENQVSGVNKEKEFFEPSRQVGADTSKYQIVPQRHFACNLMHVGRDKVLPIAYNHSNTEKIVSPAYSVFSLKKDCGVLDDYFFLMLKSDERDRYFWFQTDSSIRDGMSWEDFCNVEITVPDMPIQKKYVEVYHSMCANQQSYESGLDDLRIVCEGYIDNLRKQYPLKSIDPYIELSEDKNDNLEYGLESVRGVSIEKKLIDTKADMNGVSLKPYYLLRPDEFAYVTVTSRNGEKISIAINDTEETYICSSSYVVFRCKYKNKLLPQYLMLYFSRSEFNRYARFNSWGSARETFDWSEMCSVQIPIPDVTIQKSIAEIFTCYIERKKINEQLKAQIRDICPILIKGSLEEAKKEA